MMNEKIVFVTGKGGVGKSTLALAMAKKEAQSKRVLLVELGMRSFFGDVFNLRIGYQPVPFQSQLDISLWSGPECLSEYAKYLLKIESLYKLFFENRISRSLIEVAPALSELSILGKITSGLRKVGPPLEYDLIVVDGYATGHMLALLKAPRGMAETIQFGPMSEQTRGMLKIIQNPELCRYVIVTLPEELPATESEELFHEIKAETGIAPQVFCNKVWPTERLEQLRLDSPSPLTNEESAFMNELQDIANQQQGWVNYLKHRHPNLLSVPMVFSSDPQVISQTIEDVLP